MASNKDFKDKNLLVISPYPDKDGVALDGIFVKETVDCLKDYFRKIHVISPIPYIPSLLKRIIPERKKFWLKYHLKEDYSKDNVHVHFPKFLMLSQRLREKTFWLRRTAVENFIKNKKIEFDLIHAHFTYPSGCIGIGLKEKYGKPLLITVHEDYSTLVNMRAKTDSRAGLFLNALSHADGLIRINRKDVPVLKEYNKSVYFIPNGFDDRKFRAYSKEESRRKLNLPLDRKILLNIGSLFEQKGHKYLIDALKQIIGKRGDFLCIIIGVGDERDRLTEQINKSGLSEHVLMVGGKPHSEIPLWMNACDIFVLPSISEGNPTVMFEAIGCGKPFIGTAVGGVPEVITDEKVGLLVEPKNPRLLAEALSKALDKNWDTEYIMKYSDNYTWSNIAEELVEVYRKHV